MPHFDIIEKQKSTKFQTAPTADRRAPRRIRKAHGFGTAEKTAFSAERTGNEFRPNREMQPQ
jgi:hypothetical protein